MQTLYNRAVLTPIFSESFTPFTLRQMFQEIKALFHRLVLQSFRRSSFLIAGLIQPLLWLLLFGALFRSFMLPLVTDTTIYYHEFLSSGIIVFTAFTSSLNAGLPIMFDREFGFFNRLMVVPMTSRLSIVIASFGYIVCVTVLQMFSIFTVALVKKNIYLSINITSAFFVFIMLVLLISMVTICSIILAFVLPGHIELLALILLLNLPVLFSSTALAPLLFMPTWLKIIATINPLTYAIEALRYTVLFNHFLLTQKGIPTIFGLFSVADIILYFLLLNIVLIVSTNYFFYKKLE